MSAQSMWGELDNLPKIKTPLATIREQASMLTDITKGVLKGKVIIKSEMPDLNVELYIVAPSLADYKYHILTIRHGINIYPLTITNKTVNTNIRCGGEEEYLRYLKAVLSSEKVKKAISSLISQSES